MKTELIITPVGTVSDRRLTVRGRLSPEEDNDVTMVFSIDDEGPKAVWNVVHIYTDYDDALDRCYSDFMALAEEAVSQDTLFEKFEAAAKKAKDFKTLAEVLEKGIGVRTEYIPDDDDEEFHKRFERKDTDGD